MTHGIQNVLCGYVALFLLVGFGWSLSTPAQAKPRLVKCGQAKAVVVLGVHPNPAEQKASETMVETVHALSGARLPVLRWGEPDPHPKSWTRLYIGRSPAMDLFGITDSQVPGGGYLIRMNDKDVLIVGDDRTFSENPQWQMTDLWDSAGTMFGVQSVLRDEFGVRWIWPGKTGRVAPPTRTLKFRNTMSRTYVPQIPHRYIHQNLFFGRNKTYRAAMPWFSSELLQKMEIEEAEWSRRMGLRRDPGYWTRRGHAFTHWWHRYRVEEPAMFALQADGHREPATGPGAVKLCVSQPKVWQQILKEWMSEGQSANQVSISENDGSGGYCTCEACRAWDEGATTKDFLQRDTMSLSDRYVRFANAVAETFRDSGHELPLAAYAYQIYSDAPVSATLDSAVRLRFVPGEYPSDASMRKQLRTQWDSWREHGAERMYWRPNVLYQGNGLPLVYGTELAEELEYFASRGLMGVNVDNLGGFYATWGSTAYVLARKMESPETPIKDLEEEFYSGFGMAEGAVRDYFGHFRSITRQLVEPGPIRDAFWSLRTKRMHWAAFYGVSRTLYNDETLRQADALLQQAEQDVQEGSVEDQARVAQLRLGFEGIQKTMAALDSFYFSKPTTQWLRASEVLPTARALREHRLVEAETHAMNTPYLSWRETVFGDITGLQALHDVEGLTPVARLPTYVHYRLDSENIGLDEHWSLTLRPEEGWEYTATWVGTRSTRQAMRWTHDNDWKWYSGPIWYLVQIERPKYTLDTGNQLYFPKIDGPVRAWLDGVELTVDGAENKGPRPITIELPESTTDRQALVLRVGAGQGAGGLLRPMWLLQDAPQGPAEEKGQP